MTAVVTDNRLAVDGGEAVVPSGYLMHGRWPRVSEADIDALVAVVRSNLMTEMSGRDWIYGFEAELCAWFGARHALTTNSGTAALHCALAAVGVSSGDEVVLPALTYIACAGAVLHHQAIPVFADVDPLTFNVTPESVEARITESTKAIMVVHLHGLPADLDGIAEVARRHGIPLVEDFSQAVGATYRGRRVGTIGDAGAASLMAGKNLPSAGEAGVLLTNRREVRNAAASLKCFGEAVEADGTYTALHETMGWNYRANVAALAVTSRQLFRLDQYNAERAAQAARLDAVLRELPGYTPPATSPAGGHVYHMYRVRFDPAAAGLSVTADQAREALRQVFWAEGLPLVEFQNVPLPGHALLQQKVGYGRGCPWTCHGVEPDYRVDDYPGALDAIRHSLVIGYPARAAVANPAVVDAYARCFEKVHENRRAFERFAASLPDQPPWAQPARLF